MSAIILPIVSVVERREHHARLTLEVAQDLVYFQGHFPQVPLLPGVVQLTWAIELARTHLKLTGQFQSLASIKFMHVIQPGSRVDLLLDHDATRHSLQFEYRIEPHSCSAGTVRFAVQ
jgi:3-hydroxymyristoyl/3-hydroxydecanoyl-(acyl carrier protein) dehydratase